MEVKKEIKTTEIKNPEYKISQDKKMLGIFLLVLASTMQIFAFLKVPVFTTLHSYTIGMLLGSYNPFFYVFLIYISLTMIFAERANLPRWIKFSRWSYLFLAIAITFIGSSSGYFQSHLHNGWTVIGSESWNLFPKWFHMFTVGQSPWYPSNINGGLIGVFLFSFSAMITSGIGAFIVAIVLVVISASILATGTGIGLYRDLLKKRNLDLKKNRSDEEKRVDYKRLEVTTREDFVEKEEVKKEEPEVKKETKKEDLPFEDPFA